MNKALQNVDIEKILFFDIEVVRRSKELDINSREFELYQKKIRNRETDELLPSAEVVEDYQRRAALKMGYNRIVSIGVGFVKGDDAHIKAIDQGTEEDIIREFCKISQSFDYICGMNIIAYDLPIIITNGVRYFNIVNTLPDRFNTSGKKPWELKAVIDLMEQFRGTHYANTSLDEICFHFDLPSSKTELDGSKVSDEYWNNGVAKVSEYVKQDVLANINILKKMRFEPIFDSFKDRSTKLELQNNIDLTFGDSSVLEKIYRDDNLNDNVGELKSMISAKKLTLKDKKNLQNILEGVYIRSEFMKEDTPDIIEKKKTEIQTFIKTL
ncbi:MAG: ribonuclease H-like domain-containing protein [Lachnospiraceae bacterium]|jgi:predicted PolB exonuclease-like 3'-5' exonuclease|nr:ribonuclease H-like domain-containing protein [Lachnospiraceae bacterium]